MKTCLRTQFKRGLFMRNSYPVSFSRSANFGSLFPRLMNCLPKHRTSFGDRYNELEMTSPSGHVFLGTTLEVAERTSIRPFRQDVKVASVGCFRIYRRTFGRRYPVLLPMQLLLLFWPLFLPFMLSYLQRNNSHKTGFKHKT